jgi:general transcription factor 3C protein 4
LIVSGEGYIAHGSADGSVGLIKITQVLQEADGEFHFAQNFRLEVTVERGPELIFGPDKTGITALRWVDIVGRGVSPASKPLIFYFYIHSGHTAHSRRLQTWNRASLDCSWRRIRLDGISLSPNQDTKSINNRICTPSSLRDYLSSAARHSRPNPLRWVIPHYPQPLKRPLLDISEGG